MFVTNWNSTTKIQKISEITNFFRHYFLSRTEVEVPPFAKSDTFEGMNTDACTLFVPKGAKDNYWLADGWEKFKNIVEE